MTDEEAHSAAGAGCTNQMGSVPDAAFGFQYTHLDHASCLVLSHADVAIPTGDWGGDPDAAAADDDGKGGGAAAGVDSRQRESIFEGMEHKVTTPVKIPHEGEVNKAR